MTLVEENVRNPYVQEIVVKYHSKKEGQSG